jgi:hypothetical protein
LILNRYQFHCSIENVNASISQVEVKKEGDGFIVNTELKDDAELKNNMTNNKTDIQSELSNKTDIQSESSNETDICLESIKSQYVSALDLVHAQISAEVREGDNTFFLKYQHQVGRLYFYIF